MEILEKINQNFLLCCKLSDYLADHPELSGFESKSCDQYVSLLEKLNIPVQRDVFGQPNSFKAVIHQSEYPILRVALLSEYDALPNIGHACGHCVSGCASLLAALCFLNCPLPINVDLLGTPDEEVGCGKAVMAEHGCFDNYDCAMMIHMDKLSRAEMTALAVIDLQVEFFGKSSHAAAAPWDGCNALNALLLFYHAADMLRQHLKPGIMLHGVIEQGGAAANIVPDYTKASFYVRGPNSVDVKETIEKLKQCAEGCAVATFTTVKSYSTCIPSENIQSNSVLKGIVTQAFSFVGIDLNTQQNAAFGGSTDFGNVSKIIPAISPTMKMSEHSLHTAAFGQEVKSEAAHNALRNSAIIMAKTILSLCNQPDLIHKMKLDFQEKSV